MDITPRGMRLHIAIFGRRNVGKSSLINALTNQDIALVSPMAGTTTDPVYKAMEILPIGPVEIIDTAGIDDEGFLGQLRIKKTMQVLNKTDLALIVIDPVLGLGEFEIRLKEAIEKKNIPIVFAVSKADTPQFSSETVKAWETLLGAPIVPVSSITKAGIEELKRQMIKAAPRQFEEPSIIGDLLRSEELAVLVVPIDTAAPKGRLILPQVQTLRDILDHNAMSLVVKERDLPAALSYLAVKPKIVITDSQAFGQVAAVTPDDVLLTSFSILMARYKGDLQELVKGAAKVRELKPGNRILIAEACTHHRQDDDIGKVKIPRLLSQYVGGELRFEWSSGTGYPENLAEFDLVVHCGACMINRREMLHRIAQAKEAGVPIVNYGVLLAFLHGILERALMPFPHALQVWEETAQIS